MSKFDLSKCKPFDAKAAMEGKPVVSGLGEKRIVLVINKPGEYPVVTCNENGDGIRCNTIKGNYSGTPDATSIHDLFMAPEIVTVWVNIYNTEGGDGFDAYAHESKEAADNGRRIAAAGSRGIDYLGTISGTIEL